MSLTTASISFLFERGPIKAQTEAVRIVDENWTNENFAHDLEKPLLFFEFSELAVDGEVWLQNIFIEFGTNFQNFDIESKFARLYFWILKIFEQTYLIR